MTNHAGLYIFGEVLFDCFPTGEEILGGAPFNVAWHLQALGNQPGFISRVGKDSSGSKILYAMEKWGLDTTLVQIDNKHPTGKVQVTIENNEPYYEIVENCAYDFISDDMLSGKITQGILYHGSLCLRNPVARSAYSSIIQNTRLKIFMDVNLRAPWWKKDEVFSWLQKAHWAKMNQDELKLLVGAEKEIESQMAELQTACGLEQIIVTRGEQGTMVRTAQGKMHSLVPDKIELLIDTVGAGDAFSAVYIHGILADLPVDLNLRYAQQFAGKVIGLRGATTDDLNFYNEFTTSL
ncbi:PfkB2 [Desulforapulum autotrophicum HRM2]|uniref:PfkB2 n=1 Tax=Desulforapulum autotrophicum (strain ATCC 43914 / DSM 3382 / VKM B-1955 / HRM2) TaxID=177437 RepID=C0QFV3_DESAH|nr:carbohydrate kinase [Desulforapulum autotrophicum]ACN15521.1 PfkB2 [Desulforapulum autotrophicum HRM2]